MEGGNPEGDNIYLFEKYVSFILQKKDVICLFTPPKGERKINQIGYNDSLIEETILSYLLVANWLQDKKDWEYYPPFFMQKKYIDGNLSLLQRPIINIKNNKFIELNDELKRDWSYFKDEAARIISMQS